MKKYILSRPVNALRKGYEPAFLGAKIRARKPSEFQAAIIEKSVQKKLHSSEDWNYKTFCVFKGVTESGELEYRKCLSPSPSTAAAEAYLINDLVELRDVITLKNVYSYNLSNKNASTNYKYFLPNYEARNIAILSCLNESHDLVAVFFDIEKFYPSVNLDFMKQKLTEFYDKTKKIKDTKIFIDFALNQLSKSSSGIPIGTELSHLLANIFLTDFDKALSEKYGNRFFRYVDDITVICHKNEIQKIKSEVNGLIKDIGLLPNETKSEVYSLANWKDEIGTAAVVGEDFFHYCQMLEGWIKSHPSKYATVKQNLRDEGFHIPIEKIIARNSTRGVASNATLDLTDIITKTKRLREEYKHAAMKIALTSANNHTRGSLQKARRAINPLFYLLDTSEYKVITEVAEGHPKLSVQREVSKAVTTNNCSSIINYPGSTVSSYCEIWKTVQRSINSNPLLIHSEKFDTHQLDSLLALSLHNVVQAPDEMKNVPIWRALRSDISRRSNDLTGFENEIESLRINLNVAAQDDLLGRRESDDEEIDMQALDLGDQMISN